MNRPTRYRPMDLGYADGPQWVYLAEEVDAELTQLRAERDHLLTVIKRVVSDPHLPALSIRARLHDAISQREGGEDDHR